MILFLILAILGFCASAVVHVSTFLNRLPAGVSRAWPLHVGLLLVFIPALLSQRQDRRDRRQRSLREEYSHAPRWMLPPMVALFVYAIVNAAVGLVLMMAISPGKIVERDGRHVIVRQGVDVRPASEAEYQQDQARTLRLFSGGWMMIYWFCAVGLVDAVRRRRLEAASAPHARSTSQPLPTGGDGGHRSRPAPRLRPWGHATLIAFLRIVGCFGFFLVVASCTVSLGNRPHSDPLKTLGCVGFLLVLPAALFGATVPPGWVARRLAARCPFCNGRAYCDGAVTGGRGLYNVIYACHDCGLSCRTDGSPV
jgi:hypothetical protein